MGPAVPFCNTKIKSRFSTMLFSKGIKNLSHKQTSWVIKNGFSTLLNLPQHFRPPKVILQLLLEHTSITERGVFQKKFKTIRFKKDMVNRIFGFSPGTIHFVFKNDDPDVKAEVKALRQKYTVNGRVPMKKLIEVMLSEHDDEGSFMRSFIWFFISTVLCPRTYADVCSTYLLPLRDPSVIPNLDYGDLCIGTLLEEIDIWRDKVFKDDNPALYNRPLYIGGCLPVLGVVFLDFVDFSGYNVTIDYRLPRILHVKNKDCTCLEKLRISHRVAFAHAHLA